MTKRELRCFLGMTGYYRNFCRNFSDVANPLTGLLRKGISFEWTHVSLPLKHWKLCCVVHLYFLPINSTKLAFKLEVDASGTGAGAVLIQTDDAGIEHPIRFFSKKFRKHHLNYNTTEKEALALLLAIQHFEVYNGSTPQPITVYTFSSTHVKCNSQAHALGTNLSWFSFEYPA